MASGHWTNGGGDRDINTATNYSGGAAPGNSEDMRFISDFTGGSTGPNTDMAALTLIGLALLYVGEGYTEDIGGTGNDLDISANHVWHRGTGKLWYKDGSGITDLFTVDSTAPSPTTSVANITGSAVTLLQVLRGGVTVDGAGTVTNVVVGQRTSGQTDANLTLTTGTTVTDLKMYGGAAASSKAVTTATVFGGTLTQDTATITTLYVFGGRVNFNFAGTITNVYHYGGVIDVTRSGGAKTFTNYYKAPGARLIGENNGLLSIGTKWDVSNE